MYCIGLSPTCCLQRPRGVAPQEKPQQQRSLLLHRSSALPQQRPRPGWRAFRSKAANNGGNGSPPAEDSDVAFVAKLVVVSFALGAVIKYGSLWLDAPFQADPALALSMVALPPLGYAAYLLTLQGKEQQPR